MSNNINKEWYNQLRNAYGVQSGTRRKRQQIVRSGKVLTAEVLDQLDQEQWEVGDGTSSESNDDDQHGQLMDILVLPNADDERQQAEQMEVSGLESSCTSFCRTSKPHVDPDSTARSRSRGQGRARGGCRGGGDTWQNQCDKNPSATKAPQTGYRVWPERIGKFI